MKKTFIIPIVIVIILVLVLIGWQFFQKKSSEGGTCKNNKNCLEGLKCVTNICSSGKVGSPCLNKNDCQTGFCVGNKCTEGKEGDPCNTAQDCQEISLCKNSTCLKISELPDEETFKIYFTDMGLGNLPTGGQLPMDLKENVDVFNRGEQICLYGTIVKEVTVATAIYKPATKTFVIEKMSYPRSLTEGGFAGCGTLDIPAGKYEYKAYVGDALVALFPFEVR